MCCRQRCGRKIPITDTWKTCYSSAQPLTLLFKYQYQCRLTCSFNSYCLTYKDIPLCIQVPLVGQAASHDIKAVVVAGLHRHQPSAVWAVHHLQQRSRTLRCGVYLHERKRQKDKKISPQPLKQKTPTQLPQGARDRVVQETQQRGQPSLSGPCLCGPEIWETDEGVWLSPLGVSATPGDVDSPYLCKTLFAPCSIPCMMWDLSQGCKNRHPKGTGHTQAQRRQ